MNSTADIELPCSLLRRSLAICYDTVVVIALWFAATSLLFLLTGVSAIVPGQNFYFLYWPYLLLWNWLYLGLSWRYGKQTLGMKAWQLHLHNDCGEILTWTNSARRYLAALAAFFMLGIGFISSIFRQDKLTWQDRASGSWPVFRPKNKNPVD